MMRKLELAFRHSVLAAIFAIAALTAAGPASADTYTMQDYYAALAAVENDSLAVESIRSDINYLESQIAWENSFYDFMKSTCSPHNSGGTMGPNWYAYYDCLDGYEAERAMVVGTLEADRSLAEYSLMFAEAQLGTSQGHLALVMSHLGIQP